MKPVNIFTVSRYCDEELFNKIEKHESGDHARHSTRIHEIMSLRRLVDGLTSCGMTVSEADGFYWGFIIPQIGKEFDLLKVTERHCLNIELKSREVSEEQIAAQLRKNRHYLTYLGKRTMLYTVETGTMTCYKLTLADNLARVELREIAEVIRKCDSPYDTDIARSFRASEYLISPIRNPDRFIKGKYFLTPAQEYIRKEILRGIDEAAASGAEYFHITGRPGTGKTLLLYDLARTLSDSGLTLLVHCSELAEGERIINREITNLDIVTSDDLRAGQDAGGTGYASELGNYDFILVDESHRLTSADFEAICRSAEENSQVCIFSSDPETVLTSAEKDRDISGRIHELAGSSEYELSERLHMNMELHTFIMTLRRLTYKSEVRYSFDDVTVSYANDTEEAARIISYFRSRGYVFINACAARGDDRFSDISEGFDERHLIGREFDKVVMLMDSSFYYDEEGHLQGIPQPDPEEMYPNLFYPSVTRVREKLALIILDAPELLRSILGITG